MSRWYYEVRDGRQWVWDREAMKWLGPFISWGEARKFIRKLLK